MQSLRFILLGFALFAAAPAAQPYPDKDTPLKVIVPFGPGGETDVLARAYGKAITEVSGMNVVVDNRPGAEGVIGVQALMNSRPDGYTLFLASSSIMVYNPVLISNLPYDPFRDFVPVLGLSKNFPVINLGPSTTFKTIQEFVSAAKANPGKYTFGT